LRAVGGVLGGLLTPRLSTPACGGAHP
jgi:hypothetical protein